MVHRILQKHHHKQGHGRDDDEHHHPSGRRRGNAGILPPGQGGNAQEELADHIHNVPPVDHTDRNQCTEVEQDGKEHVFLLHVLHPEKRLKQGQMAGAGDGQEFRHALDNPH